MLTHNTVLDATAPLHQPHHTLPSHNPQLAKPLQHILIHATQPLLLEPLLPTRRLHRLLDMLPYESDEVDLVHRVRVEQVALAHVLGGLGFGWVVGFGRPVETAALVSMV